LWEEGVLTSSPDVAIVTTQIREVGEFAADARLVSAEEGLSADAGETSHGSNASQPKAA
jgi:hypothetical protein